MSKEETFVSKNIAKFKDFTMPKCTSSGFFLSINYALKEFSQQQGIVIHSRILCNIM